MVRWLRGVVAKKANTRDVVVCKSWTGFDEGVLTGLIL